MKSLMACDAWRIFWDGSLAGRVRFIRLGEELHLNWAYHFLYHHNYFVHCAMFVILSAKGCERMIKTTFVVEIQKGGTIMSNSWPAGLTDTSNLDFDLISLYL